MTDKEKLIEWIESLPNELQYAYSEGDYDNIDIVVFTKPKTREFLEWYFGP